jgi:cytosine/adenosine deaminase-related metal-dependent hydrolase
VLKGFLLMGTEYSLSVKSMVTPDEVVKDAHIRINEGKIVDFSASEGKSYTLKKKHILFPALFNAHDHLFGTYYPKIGDGPYVCWFPWDFDLKSADTYEERNKNKPYDIYLLGSYKNLLSGVTTVHDHIPHVINDPFIEKLPIRVLKDYALSHEVSSYDLKWGDGIDIEHRKAVKNDIAYVTHVEEGWDQESIRGIDILVEHNALTEHTVMIHGIGFSPKDIELVARSKAHFIWCPGSNMFMFGKTAKIREILQAGINTCIGTDSPSSGEINLLEEIRFAKKVFHDLYGEELDDREIVRMITINPARAFRMANQVGSLEKGKLGDLLIVEGHDKNPYTSLVNARLKDIALVIREGVPLYGDADYGEIFDDMASHYTSVKIEGTEKLISGDPQALMDKVRKNVGFHKELPFLPI